jgi:hypothetical protein
MEVESSGRGEKYLRLVCLKRVRSKKAEEMVEYLYAFLCEAFDCEMVWTVSFLVVAGKCV